MKEYVFKRERAKFMKWIKHDDPMLYKYIRHHEYLGRKLTRKANENNNK